MHSFTGDRLFPISNCEECFCIHVCMYKPLHLYYMLDGERERKDKIKLNAATMISTAKKYCVHWTENIYVHRLNRRSMFSRLFRISLTFFILVDSLLISTSPSYFFGCLSWHNLSYFSFFFLLQIQMLKPFTVRSIVLGQDLSMMWYFQQIFEYSICAWKIALCIWFPFPSLLSNGASFFQNFHRIYEHV